MGVCLFLSGGKTIIGQQPQQQQQNGFGGGFNQNNGFGAGGNNGYPGSNQQQGNRPYNPNNVPATIQQQYAPNGGYQY